MLGCTVILISMISLTIFGIGIGKLIPTVLEVGGNEGDHRAPTFFILGFAFPDLFINGSSLPSLSIVNRRY